MKRGLIWKIALVIALAGVALWRINPMLDVKDQSGKVVKEGKINLGLDLQGGMHLVLRVDTSKIPEDARKDASERALEVIRNRIDEFGVKEPQISPQGKDEIVVQLPGITDRARALDLIGKTAQLEFKLVSSDPDKLNKALQGDVPAGFELQKDDNGDPLLIEKDAVLTGDALTTAFMSFDQSRFNDPYVSIQFSAEGAKKFAKVTQENVGRRLAIVLDGKVKSAPEIKEAIPSGQAQITGRFSKEEASDLAIVLKVGALPAPVYIEEERTVGPLLGQDSINSGIKATLYGALFVGVFMLIYYLLAGFIADIAMALNIILLLGAMAYFKVTLTLPGIAGIVLTLGMAVDANVLIQERMREELEAGKTLGQAIRLGYDRAMSAIIDSNLTTVVAAIFLFQFGTGPIRGFALTLIIGLLISMFTSVFVTRVIFEVLLGLKVIKGLPMLKAIGTPKIDYIKIRWICYALSAAVLVVGMGTYFMKGADMYGVDFKGGQVQEFKFQKTIEVKDVRNALAEINLGNSSVQQLKDDPKVFIVRVPENVTDEISKKFDTAFKDNKAEVIRIDKVGPSVGNQLRTKAIYAIVFSMLGIMVYVAFRFKHWYFAVPGVIALFHDVFIAMGFMALTGREMSLLIVSGLLTIAGFSINDTIVIYDRIRENARLNHKLSLKELVNLSVNQTMSRTLLTSFTVLVVVVILYMYGGSVLNDFAFCLMVGFVSGVYSTVFIASPLMLLFHGNKKRGL
ncbi:MAG: protein translocase subunit SecD [Candidatus Omnitrophota bacterium]|jgi:SecD/SecF fusion protein